jgi:hypothetical protein
MSGAPFDGQFSADGGGLLRKDLSPKKVYTALKKLIHEEWSTRAAGKRGVNTIDVKP